MGRLQSKVAVVTGAGRGLGLGVARRLAREGADIFLADIDAKTGPIAADMITRDYGVKTIFRATDIGTEADAKAMIAEAHQAFGRIDILVNAAQGFTPMKFIEESTTEMYDFSLRTGLYGSIWTMQAALPALKAAGDGRIINFTSMNAVSGEPLFSDYNSTKEAIRGLTKTAAREWGRFGIRVNCIAPAGLSPAHVAHETENPDFAKRIRKHIALGYVGDPEEDIGGAALCLCSEEGRFITGMTIFADGGLHLLPVSSFDLEEWETEKPGFNPSHDFAPASFHEG
jgi:NAD(P)-dependent dehydrogenase (short-subunit alcohol dehydrogenase family)